MKKIEMKPMTLAEAQKLGIDSWDRWGCEPSVFDWSYPSQETCFVFEGDVIVTAYGEDYHITPNMMVVFPKGLNCVWDVKKTIKKAYKFD